MQQEGWTTIGDVAEVFDGPHATPKKVESGPYFLGIKSLDNGKLNLFESAHVSAEDYIKWTRRITPEAGDVVFSYETRLGEAAIIPEGLVCCLGRRMGLLRPRREKVIPEFLLYAYLAPEFQEVVRSRTIHGSTVDRLSIKDFPNFPIRIPPLSQQKATVEILSLLDRKLELNRHLNHLLEQTAQTLFRSWFIDFDPVRAKARAAELGRDPERAAMAAIAGVLRVPKDTSGMSAEDFEGAEEMVGDERLREVAGLFPERLVEGESGVVPEGWNMQPLKEVVSLTMGQSPKSEFYNDRGEGLPFHQGVTNYGVRFPRHEMYCTVETRIAQAGDILFSVRAPVGRINVADRKLVLGRGLAAMRHRDDKQSYLLYLLKSSFQSEDSIGSGTIFNAVTKKELESFPLLVPSPRLVERFETAIEPIDSEMTVLEQQIQELSELRDSLLPKLISGELLITTGHVVESELQ